MQINELQPKHRLRAKKRVGRGGKKGTYSGRGIKGQSARAGRKMEPIIRSIIKRYPKLRGYRRFVLKNSLAVVNLNVLDKETKDGEIINPQNLISKGIISMIGNKMPQVKILAQGKLNKKLIIENCKLSKAAREAIEKAGGIIK